MLFVSLLSLKATTTPEQSLPRRLQWKYPEGLKVIAEYWLQTDSPHVIVIAEADSIAPMMATTEAWSDLFNFTVVPAITAEEGLKLVSQMMPKAS
jgi:hypothetical protein